MFSNKRAEHFNALAPEWANSLQQGARTEQKASNQNDLPVIITDGFKSNLFVNFSRVLSMYPQPFGYTSYNLQLWVLKALPNVGDFL